ncbi:MAG: DUF881 domain-containing protein [Armatimonadetes bacterium]|nr:DUF881 domain-containing protein [Armatimonadota bacterium]
MSVFSPAKWNSKDTWVWPVSGMCLVLGFLLSLAWTTNMARRDLNAIDPDLGNRVSNGSIDLQQRYRDLQAELAKTRSEKTKLENAVASQTGQATVLNDDLQDLKFFAGLTEVTGPGVKVTLVDSNRSAALGSGGDTIIHDNDVVRVVNELLAAGAEAISVNNHRAGPGTSYRCVGPVLHVDGVPVASPVVIRAIGDPEALFGGLNLPIGVIAEIRSTDPSMVSIEKVSSMTLPPYAGTMTKRYAHVVKGPK